MHPVSDSLRRALRGSHIRRSRITVLDSNLSPVPGGIVTASAVTGGQVYASAGSGARRTCSVTFDNRDGLYTPESAEDLFYWNRLVKIEAGILIVPGAEASVEWVPLGVFMVDRPSMSAQKGGVLDMQVSGRDRWKMIEAAEFEAPGSYAAGTSVADMLVDAATYAGVPTNQIITASSAHTLGVARNYEEGDAVGDLITKTAADFGMRVYFNEVGLMVIEDVPAVSARSIAHSYAPGADSVVSSIKRDLTDERFANHIVVASASSDATAPVIRAVAEDNRPGSPTSIDAANGGVGRRTFRYASPLITDATVAQTVADTLLEEHLRFSAEVNLEAVCLPFLDGDDRVTVLYDEIGLHGEDYLIESVSFPLSDATSSLRLSAAHDIR